VKLPPERMPRLLRDNPSDENLPSAFRKAASATFARITLLW